MIEPIYDKEWKKVSGNGLGLNQLRVDMICPRHGWLMRMTHSNPWPTVYANWKTHLRHHHVTGTYTGPRPKSRRSS